MKLAQKKNLVGFLFCLPLLLGVLVVYAFPFGVTLVRSLQQSAANHTLTLTHYTGLFSNSAFQLAVRNTVVFWCIALPLNVVLGLGAAFLCNRHLWQRLKPVLVFPAMVPAACSLVLLQMIFPTAVYADIIASEAASPILIIALFLWKYVGYSMLILSAALYTIPKELLEAAAQCGANQWQIFAKIQLPLLHAPLAVSLLFAFLNSFKIFREVYLIGGAYPNNSLYSLQHFLSNNFSNMNFSRLAAASVLVIAVVCLALALLWHVLKRAERVPE